MKAIKLSDDKTRLDVIQAIVESSSHYTCGNVTYERNENKVHIYDCTHDDFYSTSILNELGAFRSWFKYDEALGKVVLVVR